MSEAETIFDAVRVISQTLVDRGAEIIRLKARVQEQLALIERQQQILTDKDAEIAELKARMQEFIGEKE